MVTIERYGGENGLESAELKGKSKDVKPIKGIPNGSTFYEMDTKKVFMFDKEEEVWIEQ